MAERDHQRWLRVGTRASPLALRQTEEAMARLRTVFPGWRLEQQAMTTRGDVMLDRSLPSFGQRGIFVKELEMALLEGAIDVAVHSLKDMPTEQPNGLTIAAVISRSDPRDALVLASRHREHQLRLATLPRGARLGTGSLRRAAQLRAYRPDLRIESIRGNLQTRLRKMEEEGLDGIILAVAGLDRIDMGHVIAERLPLEVCLPAPGQGAIAVEARTDDETLLKQLRQTEDRTARAETDAERTVLAALGGGCHVPIGVYGRANGTRLRVDGVVMSPDGTTVIRHHVEGPLDDAVALGGALAEALQSRGAAKLLAEFDGTATS